eukprot:6175383-Pleurochrysis_carterae.AAC.1
MPISPGVAAQDLILIDPSDQIPVASILPFCARPVHAAVSSATLERMLQAPSARQTQGAACSF